MMSSIKLYVANILLSIDQLANTLLGGDPDETISSRCGKRIDTSKVCCALCWFLDKIDSRHCTKYIENDEGDRDLLG